MSETTGFPPPQPNQTPYGQPNYQQPPQPNQTPYGQPNYQQPSQPNQAPYGQPNYQQPPQPNQTPYGQPNYQQPSQQPFQQPYTPQQFTQPGMPNTGLRSRLIAGLLGIFLGGLGIHRFYLGYTTIGIVQIIVTIATFGMGALWGFIEGIMIIAKASSFAYDAEGKPLAD